MIEEIVINIERLFKELLSELKSGNIEVKKAKEIDGFNPSSFKILTTSTLIVQFAILLIQLYIMFTK